MLLEIMMKLTEPKHYMQAHTNILDQYITDDNKIMWLLDEYNRSEFITQFLDCVEILHDKSQDAAQLRHALNHHDYNILNTFKNVDDKDIMSPQQSLFWSILPVDEGGLGEDLNISQLNKANKMFVKFGFKPIKYIKGNSLSNLQMKTRMDKLRFLRKHQADIMNTNHYNNLFN